MSDQPRRAMMVGARLNAVDGHVRPNPDGLFQMSLPEIVGQLIRVVCGRGVVLLSQGAAAAMGLPVGTLPVGPAGKNDPAAQQLRAAGYALKEIGRWFHVRHPEIFGAGVWFGLTEFIDPEFCPIVDIDDPASTTAALAHWDRLTGHVWRGSAGDAGNALLRAREYKQGRKMVKPEFWSHKGPEGHPIEMPFLRTTWARPSDSDAVYGYDRVRAYLSAMTCTDVAGEELVHDRRTVFDPKRAGWWHVTCGPWEFENVMPDPAGYSFDLVDGRPGRSGWLTTPRVALLAELAAEGFYQFEITDSWTAPRTPVMKLYGEELRTAWQGAAAMPASPARTLLLAGIKGTFRIGHGYWRSKQSTVQRSDWAAAVTATSSANLFRRVWKVWSNGGKFDGPYPVWIDTDNVFYDRPVKPDGWTIWDSQRPDLDAVTQLGHWRTGGIRRRKTSDVSRETVAA